MASAGAARLGIHDLTVSSAGIRAVVGHPIHHHAAAVLESLGGNPNMFAARRLTRDIAMAADLILTMTRGQRDTVLTIAPQALRRTFTLGEAALLASDPNLTSVAELAAARPRLPARQVPEVPDPLGKDVDFFMTVGAQIAELLQPVLRFCARIGDVPAP
ncbi:protein-tyrosine-phosphatase [Mycolicibacterium goodii]|uniref:arsenate reductase/protein-tyrosine-phosphatase family protein n=1 Tax=Mycolicibacterium goodii TaxID=134601 RepID=UPI00296FF621